MWWVRAKVSVIPVSRVCSKHTGCVRERERVQYERERETRERGPLRAKGPCLTRRRYSWEPTQINCTKIAELIWRGSHTSGWFILRAREYSVESSSRLLVSPLSLASAPTRRHFHRARLHQQHNSRWNISSPPGESGFCISASASSQFYLISHHITMDWKSKIFVFAFQWFQVKF